MRKNPVHSKLGERIKKERLSRGLSQDDFSWISEIDRAYLTEIEKGRANPTVRTLYKISRKFKLKIKDFFSG